MVLFIEASSSALSVDISDHDRPLFLSHSLLGRLQITILLVQGGQSRGRQTTNRRLEPCMARNGHINHLLRHPRKNEGASANWLPPPWAQLVPDGLDRLARNPLRVLATLATSKARRAVRQNGTREIPRLIPVTRHEDAILPVGCSLDRHGGEGRFEIVHVELGAITDVGGGAADEHGSIRRRHVDLAEG
jgi:hypothetical protein